MTALALLRRPPLGSLVARNTAWLALATGAAGVADFAVTVYVIRTFGAARYSAFGYAFSFVSLFGALFDVGLATAVTRRFAEDPQQERQFGDLFGLKLLLGAAGAVVVWAGGLLLTHDPLERRMIALLAAYLALFELANVFYGLFRARQRMEIEAGLRIFYGLCLVACVVAFTRAAPSVLSVGAGYLAAVLMTVACACAFVVRERGLAAALRPRVAPAVWRDYLTVGLFIALLRVAGDANQNIGPVTLGALGRLVEIGWYNAADKIYGVLLFPMGLLTAAMFPALAQARTRAPERFAVYWGTWARATVLLSVGLGTLVFVDAPAIIGLLYPAGFAPAVAALRILVVAAMLTYVQSLYYTVLLVLDRQRHLFAAGLASMAVHVALNFLLVPRWGLYGVAVGTVASQAVMCGLCVAMIARGGPIAVVDRALARTLGLAALAGVAMAAALAVSPHGRTGAALAALGGMLLYGGFVLAGSRVLRGRPGSPQHPRAAA